MTEIKIIIPMAGVGKRFGELTLRRPKALVRVADRRLLDHVLNTFRGLEETYSLRYVFIVGYLGEQIREYAKRTYPEKNITFYVQEDLRGQSHAVHLARDEISGPVFLTYCDTMNQTDFSFLPLEAADAIASVQEVDDPERFGVAVVGADNLITRLVEKPGTREHKLALTGLYYLSEGRDLIKAIETQIRRGATVNNEYYLADAINILIDSGMRIRAQQVSRWLDAGTPEALLETNACLLRDHREHRTRMDVDQSSVLIDPVYIHESSRVENSVIGPNVSIGENCSIAGSIIRNTIVDDGSTVNDATLLDSLIGKGCSVSGNPMRAIVGDHSEVRLDFLQHTPVRGNTS
jgi:glucose-1-phosphate thymidylyltransferase